MPRDLFRLYFHERYQSVREELNGELMTSVRQVVFGANAVPMLCADVRVSAHILSSVPVAENNNELLYAQPGTPVRLQRSNSGRLEITGLNKRGKGNITTYHVPITIQTAGSLTSVKIDVNGLSFVSVIGYFIRTLTLGELALATPGGFGETPLEAIAVFDAYGGVVGLVGAGGGMSSMGAKVFVAPQPSSAAAATASIGASATTLWVTSLGDAGGGTLRNAWDTARSLRTECVIRFSVGGTITLRSALTKMAQNDYGRVMVYGFDAPTPVVLDGSTIADGTSEGDAPHLFELHAPSCAIVGVSAINIPQAFVKVGDGARGTILEDLTITNTDGRGDVEGAIVGDGQIGNLSVSMRRVTITGSTRAKGVDMRAGVWYLQSCLVSSTVAGFVNHSGLCTLYRSRAEDQSSHAIHLTGGGTISAQEVSLANCLIDALKAETVSVATSAFVPPGSMAILSCTITGAGASGASAAHGVYATNGARIKIHGSTIRDNYGDGVRATSNCVVDLGGGILGSSGGNILRGNGITSGYDVNSLLTSSVVMKAERNIWDHLTVADVLMFDVNGFVDVAPLA
ncbi:MAG TPA: DUF1565 domain-containing protein [Alphaproteobacteria bacterium]|nr:DUF1565 domain-containing protein [Alphaproteobacteria bacterium]